MTSTAQDEAPPGDFLLEQLCLATGVAFEPALARDALRQAAREHSGDPADTWLPLLAQAGEVAGLRITPARWSVAQAVKCVEPGHPVVTCGRAPDGQPVWAVLLRRQGRKVLLAALHHAADDEWLHQDDLARRLGLPNAQAESSWGAVQPLVPCQDMAAAVRDQHGHGSPHAGHDLGPSPVRRLLGLMRPEMPDIRVVTLFAFGVGILSLATPITVEAIVNTVQGGTRILLQPVLVLTAVLAVCLGLAALLRAMKNYVVEFIQQRVFVRVVADLAYRLPRVKAEAFDGRHGPELVNRFFEVLTVQKASATLLLDGLIVVLQGLIGLVVLAFYHPWLLTFDLVLLAAMAFVIFALGKGAVRTSIQESFAKYDVAGWLEEMVRHPLAFKAPGGQDYALERADALTRRYLATRQAHFRIWFRQVVFALVVQVLASVALLGLGGWLVIERRLTLGQLVAAELIVAVVVGSFIKLGKSLESYYDLMAGVDKLGHLVDLPLERDDGEAPPLRTGPASLALHDVAFTYGHASFGHAAPGHPAGGHDHHSVLDGLSFEVAAGERIALTGPSGAGKSTIIDLLCSLRQPDRGRILLDGLDLRDVKLDVLRQHVATVKGYEVFAGTVLENVRIGRHYLSLADIRDALRQVSLLNEVEALPQGLHTPLCTGGSPLSMGQVRRLLLARAIAGKPRLLVLDEALDQLDDELRVRVTTALTDRAHPWTLLLVTHHAEVAAQCDRELIVEHGRARPAPLTGSVASAAPAPHG